jgi:hypothetical protein
MNIRARVLRVAAAASAARERDHVVDRGVLPDDVDDVPELLAHRLEGDVLRRHDRAGEPAGVLLRKRSPSRTTVKEQTFSPTVATRPDDHRARMAERPAERSPRSP